ncbi:zf-TFIIB domain-containing protein [bacterium]|nr:zf-TFIIB domain-containing protein [bacterium]
MMYCPECKDTTLKKIDKHGFSLFLCPTCEGIAILKEDLKKLLHKVERVNVSTSSKKEGGIDFFQYTKQPMPFLLCPKCSYNLYKIKESYLELDYCLNCGTFWFERGELKLFVEKVKWGNSVVLETLHTADDAILHLIFSIFKKEI